MKYLFIIAALALSPVAAQAQSLSVGVEGMTCEGCASTVKASLESLPEVRSATIDIKGARAVLALKDINAEPSDAALARAIEKAGYTPGAVSR